MIKLRDLEYLTAIDAHKHFGKAAEACFVSQPTLSGQLMKLEERLGLTLVERHRRNVMLTPAGETLVRQAKVVLNEAKLLEDTAKTLSDPMAGDMHMGLIPTLAPYLLPHIMSDLSKAIPKASLYLHENRTNALLEDLDSGKLDMLILPWLDSMENFNAYDLFEEPLILAMPAGHELGRKKRVKLADLNNHHVLTLEDGHCLRDQALGYCFSAGANEDKRFQATSLETLRYMVASGLGITLLPRLAIPSMKDTDDIWYRPFNKPEPDRRVVLLIRPNYPRVEYIRQVVSSIRKSISTTL